MDNWLNEVSLFFFYFILACLIVYYLRSQEAKDWWVKIITEDPSCTYFFGPFESSTEAVSHQNGYVEDLKEEGAQGIRVSLAKCNPKELTIPE